ncbi:hypothetical protein [Phenylobacterium sp.]
MAELIGASFSGAGGGGADGNEGKGGGQADEIHALTRGDGRGWVF